MLARVVGFSKSVEIQHKKIRRGYNGLRLMLAPREWGLSVVDVVNFSAEHDCPAQAGISRG